LFGQLAAFATLCVFIGACARGFGILDRLAVIWLVIVSIAVLFMGNVMLGTAEPPWTADMEITAAAIFGGIPWIFLRALAWAFKGTARAKRVEIIPPR
jgi:hypothetical protein